MIQLAAVSARGRVVLPRARGVFDRAQGRAVLSHVSFEHGIGVLKRDELPEVKDKTAIELMHAIKAMLDPHGIMNPGKVL